MSWFVRETLPLLFWLRGRGTLRHVRGGAATTGPTLSIPVVTGLCRAADLGLLVFSAAITGLLLRRVSDVPPWGEFIVVSTIAIAMARGLAERRKIYSLPALLNPLEYLGPLSFCLGVGALASAAALSLLHDTAGLPYLVTQPASWFLASGAVLLGFRSFVAWKLQAHAQAGRLSSRVALIGANEASLKFVADAAANPDITVVGVYDDRGGTRLPGGAKSLVRGSVNDLIALARRYPVDAIIISLPLTATTRIAEMRECLAGIATDVFVITDIAAFSFSGAQFTTVGGSPVLAISSRPLKDWPAFKKATFDRAASAVFLMLALPLMIVVAILVKLDSRGPVLFRQDRDGLNGAPFTMLKFRTMHHRPGNDESVQATVGDCRVTRIGYWLRRYSLDELPQLWNVLRGDMSLVGPRPHLATTRAGDRLFCDVVPHYQARHRMKPGLTGWAQVQGLRGETRTEREIVERVAQDLFYIDNWSLGLDLRIIGRTILREIISSSGKAY